MLRGTVKKPVADPENQWGGGDHEEKTVFETFSRQYNPYFFIFVKEKWKYKISKGVAVAETPTGGSATATNGGIKSANAII